jgi:hypothetical protein
MKSNRASHPFGHRHVAIAVSALLLTSLTSTAAHGVTLVPGDIVITAQLGPTDYGVLLVDPTTGDRTIISDNTHGTGTAARTKVTQ